MNAYVVKISGDGWTDPTAIEVQARDVGHAVRVALAEDPHYAMEPCCGPPVITRLQAVAQGREWSVGRSGVWHKITITVSPALEGKQEVLGLEVQGQEVGS